MKARTPYRKLLSASTMALLVIMVAWYLMSERASAQEVQRSIVGLQVNVNALQSSLDAQLAPMSVNFRWTPAARNGEPHLPGQLRPDPMEQRR